MLLLDMQKQKELTTTQSDKCLWTHAMDEFLIDAYINQANLGNRHVGNFTSTSLANIVEEMKTRFLIKKKRLTS